MKLQVSHMVVGTYVFVLKVTDSRSQSSEAQVKVVVLPEENTVPVAVAGDDKVGLYTSIDQSINPGFSVPSLKHAWELIILGKIEDLFTLLLNGNDYWTVVLTSCLSLI